MNNIGNKYGRFRHSISVAFVGRCELTTLKELIDLNLEVGKIKFFPFFIIFIVNIEVNLSSIGGFFNISG